MEVYEHWGSNSTGSQEPNNRAGNELCAAANASQAYGSAWGWSDVQCSLANVSAMCRVAGGACYCTACSSWSTLLMSVPSRCMLTCSLTQRLTLCCSCYVPAQDPTAC